MSMLSQSILLLGGLICLVGGLALMWKGLTEDPPEDFDQSRSFAARLGNVFTLNVGNYGPGVIALGVGAMIMLATTYVGMQQNERRTSDPFIVSAHVDAGDSTDRVPVLIYRVPDRGESVDGAEKITFEVPPESNGDPPSIWFVRPGVTRDRVNLKNEHSVTREGRMITVQDTVKLWH